MREPNDLTLYDMTADQWWDESSQFYTLNRMNPARFAYFDRYITDWKDKYVLDVGCGGGFTCEFLAQRGARVTGVDQSEQAVGAARDHARQSELEIAYEQAVGEALPFDEELFDIVVCVDVLEHVRDLGKVVSEIHRVLNPGGLFLFDTINRTWLSRIVVVWLFENVFKLIPKGVHDWRLFIKPGELANHLDNAGFVHYDMDGFILLGFDKQTGAAKARFTERMPFMYIGAAVKAAAG